jgi:hypothetical protein
MRRRRTILWSWFWVVLFAAGGFCIRLYLDSTFERLIPEREGIEMGFLDSFMIETSRGMTAEEEGQSE